MSVHIQIDYKFNKAEPEPILGFEKTYARIDEGESLEICLTNYSHPLKENVRVELKTESLRTGIT